MTQRTSPHQTAAIIDLFAGCGGFSTGFGWAGFRSILANEQDAWASETFSRNHPETKVITEDIRLISDPKALVKEALSDEALVGIIGGPPCQGFSLSGTRDPRDPRNSLFAEFLRFVDALKPKFFVLENVPGIRSLRLRSGRLAESVIVSEAENLGFNVTVMQLNAANYGVPQARNRVFFVGITNTIPFVAQRLIPPATHAGSEQLTVWQAISDLPRIESGERGDGLNYATPAKNTYQSWARRGSSGVCNHEAMRHTQRLIDRFKLIQVGQSVDDVPAEHGQRRRGSPGTLSGKSFGQNNMRVDPDRPAPTVAASFQSNFIHPTLHRNFTAREAARLQSFPDYYQFSGSRTTMSWEKNLSQYQQIGNAVPPLLARALGRCIAKYLANPPTEHQARSSRPTDLFSELNT